MTAAARRWLTPETAFRALLIFVPLAPLAAGLGCGPPVVFACACLAIIPLARIMGEATERLAARLGAGVGGLLNATFGNAAELIIALVALRKGYYGIVKASLTGSIIGNLLLVLGMAMLTGGLKNGLQTFSQRIAGSNAALLVLAAVGLFIPAVFAGSVDGA